MQIDQLASYKATRRPICDNVIDKILCNMGQQNVYNRINIDTFHNTPLQGSPQKKNYLVILSKIIT